MRKRLYTSILLFCAVAIGCSSNQEQLNEWVEKQMRHGTYPGEIEDGIWLDSVAASPGLTLCLYYSYDYALAEDFTPEEISYTKLDYKMGMLNLITSDDVEMKRFRNAGVTFRYEFRDMEGVPVFSIAATPEEYKEALKSK